MSNKLPTLTTIVRQLHAACA